MSKAATPCYLDTLDYIDACVELVKHVVHPSSVLAFVGCMAIYAEPKVASIRKPISPLNFKADVVVFVYGRSELYKFINYLEIMIANVHSLV